VFRPLGSVPFGVGIFAVVWLGLIGVARFQSGLVWVLADFDLGWGGYCFLFGASAYCWLSWVVGVRRGRGKHPPPRWVG
jgi:hypothetical protein